MLLSVFLNEGSTLEVTLETSGRGIPDGIIAVTEKGIKGKPVNLPFNLVGENPTLPDNLGELMNAAFVQEGVSYRYLSHKSAQ